ncbi:putative holin-like toxin [Brevibacillus laterosporus]
MSVHQTLTVMFGFGTLIISSNIFHDK